MYGLRHNDRRLRVTHVVGQLAVGGLERLLADFARHTDRDRFDLRFVALGRWGPVADDIAAAGWPVQCLGKTLGARPRLVAELVRTLRRSRAHVVHTHNNAGLFYGAVAARLAGVPQVIHTRHGQSRDTTPRQQTIFRAVCRLARRFVCVSEDSRRLSEREGVPADRVRRIWNGVDLARFAYTGPRPDGSVVMVGRLSPEKNAVNLLRAAARIVACRPEFRVEVAGDGACMPDLRRFAADNGLDRHVRFLGEVHDVPAVLQRASVFVLPSFTEGVSLTLLEAMACGLPIVATAVGGTPEVVKDGETGFLVPSDDPVALARRIEDVLDNPDRARAMGLAGRRRVEEEFSIDRMLAQYEALYRDRPGVGRRQAVPEARY